MNKIVIKIDGNELQFDLLNQILGTDHKREFFIITHRIKITWIFVKTESNGV